MEALLYKKKVYITDLVVVVITVVEMLKPPLKN